MSDNPLPYAELTLDEALARFREEHGLTEKYRDLSEEAQLHYERHDMIHVLFGLGTDLREEAQADGWTLLASDITWSDIRTFMKLPEEQALIAELGWWAIAKAFFRAVPDYALMAWKSQRMRKKWRWADNASYRKLKVGAVRREFGITDALAT